MPQRVLREHFPHGALLIAGYAPGRRIKHDKIVLGQELPTDTPLLVSWRSATDLAIDPRNIVWACWEHHQHIENRRVYLDPEQLPKGAQDFAAELGLGYALDLSLGGAA